MRSQKMTTAHNERSSRKPCITAATQGLGGIRQRCKTTHDVKGNSISFLSKTKPICSGDKKNNWASARWETTFQAADTERQSPTLLRRLSFFFFKKDVLYSKYIFFSFFH
jgi:hypothetical protein